jgi:hypothetical protein
MDETEQVVTQLGLLLTQMRYSRRALENIELATTKYAGITLKVAGGPGAAALGSPPLIDGALKVYVVNIDDLTSGGTGIGDMIAGVIGGAGRFLGGFFGGLVGGTVSGVAFPYLFVQMRHIVDTLERILNRLGVTPGEAPASGKEAGGGLSIMAQLGSLAETLRAVAAVFRAAAPEGSGPVAEPPVTSSVRTYLDLVRALSRVVDGLILLVPMLLGALASFLIRLDDIKLAIVDLLQFALRNVLLLRAAVLAIVLDTLSLAGRLAASVVGIVSTAIGTILESLFRVIHVALETAIAAIRIASTGIKNTIDALMLFLRDGVGAVLIALGDLRIFKLVFHLAEILPHVLPAIARIVDRPLSAAETKALGATPLAPPVTAPGSTPVPIAPFPDLAEKLLPAAKQKELVDRVDLLGKTIRDESRVSFGAVQGALDGIGARMRDTVGKLDAGLDRELTDRLGRAKGHAETLAGSLRAAEEVAKHRPSTGLEKIAEAYEKWLGGGGMTKLMGELEKHFAATPTEGATGAGSIAGRVVGAVLERAGTRAVVVEVGEVTIDLGEVPAAAPEAALAPAAAFDGDAFLEWQQNREDRLGIVPSPGLALA